jgi:hypothetical protein
LLGFIEAVDFVDKEDSMLLAELAQLLCLVYYPAQVRDSSGDGAEGDKPRVRLAGNNLCQRGFAAAGWPPEDHGWNAITFDAAAQEPARFYQVLLPHDLIEGAGAHARGQGFS